MIVSHEHRFIFIKTRKTAGTSIEVFLARHAGADAIVTPVWPTVAGHDPRHHERLFNPVPELWRTRAARPVVDDLRHRRAFVNHLDAARIRERVGRRRWDTYFTFCFERDPWEKVLSWFYWKGAAEFPDFRSYVLHGDLPSDFDAYALDGRIGVDFVGRYEHLEADLGEVLGHVGITAPVALTQEKAGLRPAPPDPAVAFTPDLDRRVAEVFGRELTHLAYEDRSRPTGRPRR